MISYLRQNTEDENIGCSNFGSRLVSHLRCTAVLRRSAECIVFDGKQYTNRRLLCTT